MDHATFAERMIVWQADSGRNALPWQQPATPYRVWISEIMLQQTQVTTVIPYFERFMAQFPGLPELAKAETESVLGLWSGLGYYARARHLHACARALMALHEGRFPASIDALMALPGIGRSTAGAILSLGMGLRAPILDGNVRRVLTRFAGIDGWPGRLSVQNQLWALSDTLTPAHHPDRFNQAMMDLGAMICRPRQPLCEACPVAAGCWARRHGCQTALPSPRPSRSLPTRQALLLMVYDESGAVFLEKRPAQGIWGGLWSLPEFKDLRDLDARLDIESAHDPDLEVLERQRHTFSHFHLDFQPVLLRRKIQEQHLPPGIWHRDLVGLALPAPIRRLLQRIGETP